MGLYVNSFLALPAPPGPPAPPAFPALPPLSTWQDKRYKGAAMKKPYDDLSRREFLEGTGAALAVAASLPVLDAQTTPAPAPPITADPSVPRTTIRVTVNGVSQRIEVEDRWTLVE